MTLTARYVRRPRTVRYCDWCERPIGGPHIYLYGAADTTDRPFPLRLHVGCCPNLENDPKITAALKQSEAVCP